MCAFLHSGGPYFKSYIRTGIFTVSLRCQRMNRFHIFLLVQIMRLVQMYLLYMYKYMRALSCMLARALSLFEKQNYNFMNIH